MNAAALRLWMIHGKTMRFDTGAPGATLTNMAPTAAHNGTQIRHFPIAINERLMDPQFGNHVEFGNVAVGAAHDGVFLPDAVNQCTVVDATAHANGIVVSGPFNGCTFAKCLTTAGNLMVGHIFRDAAVASNNPAVQATAFRAAAGIGPAAAVDGFPTLGIVAPPAYQGYIIGTFAAGAWQWDWLTLGANPNGSRKVVTRQTLGPADWVAL